MKVPAEVEEFLTTSEAAKISHVTRFTVANWVKGGKLSAVYTAGGHRRISKRSLEEFIAVYCKPRLAGIGIFNRHNLTRAAKRGFYGTGQLIGKFQKMVGGAYGT